MINETDSTTIVDAVKGAINYQLNSLRTAMPATFISFDPSDCSASVKPSIKKNYTDGTTADTPIIHKVPVVFPVAGNASITFPINPGDFCLLMCCERSTEEWKRLGVNQKPLDRRKFDLSDAVAIPGMVPFTNTMPQVGSGLTIRFGSASITVNNNGSVDVLSSSTIRLNGNGIAIGNSAVIGVGTVELINELQVMAASMVLEATPPVSPFFPLLSIFTRLASAMTAIKGTL